MTLTTHVLDTSLGKPAAGIEIGLFAISGSTRTLLANAITNADGRTDAPLATNLDPGTYELTFAVAVYFAESATAAFFDSIIVRFKLDDASPKYHVPLLLSPWGYATYRGS